MRLMLGIICLILIGSCTVKQKIHFNKDFSGKVEVFLDMSQLIAAMPQDSNSNNGPDSSFNSTFSEIESINGISNVISRSEGNGVYYFSYEFENLKALNATLQNTTISNADKDNASPYFKKRGRKLKYVFPELKDSSAAAQPEMVDGYVTFSLEIDFQSDIEEIKTESDNVTKRSDNRTLFWTPQYTNLLKKGGNIIEIKLSRQ